MSIDVIMKIVPGGAMCVNVAEASKLEGLYSREMLVKLVQPRNLYFHRM